SVFGSFHKYNEWTKNGSNRGVIACSNRFWLYSSAHTNDRRSEIQCDPFITDLNKAFIFADGSRHAPPRSDLKRIRSVAGINMLFCDGHVAAVTPAESWI